MSCLICHNLEAKVAWHNDQETFSIDCTRCGKFKINAEIKKSLLDLNPQDRSKVSSYVLDNSLDSIAASDVQVALSKVIPSVTKRADRMLRWLVVHIPPGKTFSMYDVHRKTNEWCVYTWSDGTGVVRNWLSPQRLLALGWNSTLEELRYMIENVLCSELEWLMRDEDKCFSISAKGLLYLEGVTNPKSTVGFCAMWFNAQVAALWSEAIEPAICAAGYEPLRIDSKQHNGKIDDEIMASIRGAKFVVADFTGNRGGVYYEAGFAHGLDLPVIFMCREGDDLHFDIRQYNCIFWKSDNLDDARERLKNRILATLGKGPLQVQ
jgi:hypothetical protein